MNVVQMKKDYEEAALNWGNAFVNGDHRKANKIYKTFRKMMKLLQKEKNKASDMLLSLTNHPEIAVRYWAASGLIVLQKNVSQGEAVLKAMAEDLSTGPIGSIAKISLLESQKKG